MSFELEPQSNIMPAQFKSRVILGQPERPKILNIILKTGIVKDEKGAVIVLLTLVALIFIISILLFFYAFHEPEVVAPPLDIDSNLPLPTK